MHEARDTGSPDNLAQGLADGEALYRPCDPEALEFETTDDLESDIAFVGQDRAVAAGIRGGFECPLLILGQGPLPPMQKTRKEGLK
jgi:hypothetical protein